MTKIVKPRKLAGFRDFFAEEVKIREYVINTFKKVFEKYGYEPLQTPALEYADIFLGEVGEEGEKLFYRFKDQGGRDVMLKYEVMIPMCRAVAENINDIVFPYKRYQIQNVWRADKPQKGRFREFTQCDADTIGSSSVTCDAEFIQMGIEAMKSLGFDNFKANISNRKFLNGLIRSATNDNKSFIPICMSIDKLPRIGKEKVLKELIEKRKISPEIADKILALVTKSGEIKKLLQEFKKELNDSKIAQEGLQELEKIFDYLEKCHIDSKSYCFAPYIARGLAYYTGPIWEFEILEGDVGSVAGCGRYDNVIGRFVGKQVPATGGSFGIERIVEVIKEREMIDMPTTSAQVLVTFFNEEIFDQSLAVANLLRSKNVATILYPEVTPLDKQLKYADKKGIPYVVIIGPEEVKGETVTVKNLKTGDQKTVGRDKLITEIGK